MLDNRIWYAPDGVDNVSCVARTRRGRQCANTLEHGQIANWVRLRSTRGVITAYDLSQHDQDTVHRWLTQHCVIHDSPDTVDFTTPGWEPFDATGMHSAMVTSLEDLIAEHTRKLREGVTAEWRPWHPWPL